MWYVALSLGLLGSIHCVGMCGPLAIAFCNKKDSSQSENLKSSVSYNLGRTVTYSFLGLLFGMLGSFVVLLEFQKVLSISLGLLLVVTFLFNVDVHVLINKNYTVKKYYFYVKNVIATMMKKADKYSPFQLGIANGFLPCGLVYLALAGALSIGDIAGGVIFMAIFGLGTIPMLCALTMGVGMTSIHLRRKFKTILPFVSLAFGLFLIYRGIMVDMPRELSFWEALKNPILCH